MLGSSWEDRIENVCSGGDNVKVNDFTDNRKQNKQ